MIHILVNDPTKIIPATIVSSQIYEYYGEPGEPRNLEDHWKGRLVWKGSKDMQDISIGILNVTLNDTGTYKCMATRQYKYEFFTSIGTKNITINLKVKEKGKYHIYHISVFRLTLVLQLHSYCTLMGHSRGTHLFNYMADLTVDFKLK